METQFKKSSKLKRAIRKKAFTAWANSILERNRSSTKIDDLFKSFRNGQLLCKLIENISDEKVRRLSPVKSRQQSVDNVEICLDFLEKKRVSTRCIDAEDIVDGCPDTTLELMWVIITGLYINKKELLKKEEKKKTVEEALLLWAQDKTKGYRDVRVKDFTSSSWKDGLSFLALISAHRPNLIHFKDLHNDELRHNLKTAFDKAENGLGIPSLLDVEDLMKSQVDKRSVAAYVACFYKRFADKRRRRSRSESRSDDSDTSSSSEATHSGGDRTERKKKSRSTSKTRRSSRNKHKQRESLESSSSSSSSKSSDQCKGRRRLKKENERGHNSVSSASSSSERTNIKRGGKNRCSSSSGGTPKTRKDRKGFRNISEKGTVKSNSHERNRSDGKMSKSRDTQRSIDRSLSWTRSRRDWRSHSRERKHSSDRSLSRTRHSRDRQSLSRERKHSSDRSLSRTRHRRDRQSLSRERTDRSLSRTRHRKDGRSLSRERKHSSDRSLSRTRNRKKRQSRSRERKHSSDRSPSRTRNRRKQLRHSRERKHSSDRSLSRTRNRRDRRSHSRERKHGSGRSLTRTRHDRNRRMRSFSNSLERRSVKNKGNSGRYERSPGLGRNKNGYKEDLQVRERRNRSCSSSQEEEYHRTGASQFHTFSRKQSKKYFNPHQKTLPDDWSEIRKEIRNLKRYPGFSRNDNSQGEDIDLIKKLFLRSNMNYQTVPLAVPFNLSPVQFEWQFQDEHGAWITYGKANSAFSGSNATTTTSDNIENHFVANPNSPPVLVQTKHNHYILDFQSKTQTNMNTNVQRPIRRIPKQSANITPLNAHIFPLAPVSFEWQFQDEHGSWISYGKPNSAGDVSHATTTCSDDIERHFASNITNPAPLTINSNNNTLYVLDLVGKTQTNQNTAVQRPIRRIQKQSPTITSVNLGRGLNLGAAFNPNILHEWQFEDEHGSWITFGKPNSAGNVSHITTTCSDDIEKHYVSNPANLTPLTINSKNNAQYVLDFQNMTQTNQQTSVQRKTRRVPKASPLHTAIPEGSTFVWSFKDEHGHWIKYGETSSSNDVTSASTTTSDDIETKYARNPTASLEIASGHHKYIIDFNAMTQTNINTGGIRAIRRQLVTPSDLPSHWTPMKASDKGLRVVALKTTDTEYINQVAFVKKTLSSGHTITKVFRIQNEHLWKDFVSRKKRLKRRNPQIKYKEVYLFHDTDHRHVQSICADNLDFRLNGTNGTKYGQGTYFATSAAYSAMYASSGTTKLMFIVKVLIGHYTVGSTSLRRPPKDASGVFYDATVDNQANPTIYVKYDNTEYYPEYYIEFT